VRVEVQRLAEGLWRWTAHHEEWDHEVGCVYVETDDAIVLVDPLVPAGPAQAERFWHHLENDMARAAVPAHVVVCVHWHARSAREVVARTGARLWCSRRGRAAIVRRAGEPTDLFDPGDALPGGVRPYPSGRGPEVLLWLEHHRTLVAADVLLGAPLRLCPPSWLPAGRTHATVRAALAPLLDLPVERILTSHGEPVLEGGAGALAALLRG